MKTIRKFLRRLLRAYRSHKQVRYVVPTKAEISEARRQELNRRASINGQLAVYAAMTTQKQWAEETAQFFAKARSSMAGRG